MSKKQDTGIKVGYARVSTDEQFVDMQLSALKRHGVLERNIYHENASGAKRNRPQLAKALRALSEGDTFVVWKFDRIARTMSHLLDVVEGLEERGVAFTSLTESIDTSSAGGKLFLHMLAAFAQFERDMGRERTKAGVAEARAKGIKFGPDFKLKEKNMPRIQKLIREKGKTFAFVGASLKPPVSGQTVSRRLRLYEENQLKIKETT